MTSEFPRVRIENVGKGRGLAPGWATKVYIDGTDVSECFTDVQVHAVSLDEPVTATMTVVVTEIEFDSDMPAVVSPETAQLLERLGWTPPAADTA